jgi:hypothetical protein
LYIINSAGIVYHQDGVLHIIKPTKHTHLRCDDIHGLRRDEIQRALRVDDMPSLVGLDKKRATLQLLFFGAGKRTHICFANLPCSAAKRTSRFPACAPSACEICQRACFA